MLFVETRPFEIEPALIERRTEGLKCVESITFEMEELLLEPPLLTSLRHKPWKRSRTKRVAIIIWEKAQKTECQGPTNHIWLMESQECLRRPPLGRELTQSLDNHRIIKDGKTDSVKVAILN